MSKSRTIHTKIWTDTWFEELNFKQKLLFIYLLTNDKTNMLGIYEVSLRKISYDTGLDKKDVSSILMTFTRAGKLVYKENHIILCNFLKHQSYNPNMKVSAINSYNDLPTVIKGFGKKLETKDLTKGWQSLYKELSNAYSMLSKIEVEVETEVEGEIEIEIPDFDLFWDSFHSLTGKPKTDMQPAKKHWDKLTAEEKEKAISFIPQYSSSNSDKRYLKKARTYLADKNFNDEIVGAKKIVVDDQGKERKIAFTRPDGSVVYEPTTNPTLEQIKAERV